MIKRPTVLVLGAGASQPYGFPLGAGLVDQVCAEILGGEQGLNAGGLAYRLQERHRNVQKFAIELSKARPYSIDAFIETRSEFRSVGKAAIADVLLRAERSSTLGTASSEVDWYRYLLNRILVLRNPAYFTRQARQLTIVTFNFDRSFEQALFTTLRANFGRRLLTDARQLATELPIHHIHGSLGPLDLLSDEADATQFGPPDSELANATRIAAERIKVVDDEIEEAVVDDAVSALQQAECVYFLGFGFDKRNLRKLRIPDCLARAPAGGVRGTAFGLTTIERSPIARAFGIGRIRLKSADALTFVRTHAVSLFE